ncbi:hypothetical protein MATL_G00218160 [Megalops atlanticus]|uniref:Uncharacterized protein n=1 Tax=Megalops atlanticus TaxID=7932 RepID=A0A9D3PIV6_MEGAT|nr:hypothetical protein MATL_G00218160 [Megalops atlanticus]
MHLGKATILVSIICSIESTAELLDHIDRYTYCESCLATTQEMETIERKLSGASRRDVVDMLLDDALCNAASFQSDGRLPADKMRAACKHLLDVHGEEFRAALLRRESERLDILLCYERSLACVGVNRLTHQNKDRTSFTDSDIKAQLRESGADIRIVRPVHTNITTMAAKDEL